MDRLMEHSYLVILLTSHNISTPAFPPFWSLLIPSSILCHVNSGIWTSFGVGYFFQAFRSHWQWVAAAAAAKSLQSCPTLGDPIDCSPPGSPVPGILQARTLEWVAISFSNAWKWKAKCESEVAQSCLTLSDPMDCSLPGSSAHGIFQARVLEWVAIALSYHMLNPCRSGNPHILLQWPSS